MAGCQQWEGVVWSGLLRDGKTVILLLREQLGTRKMGCNGMGREVVRGNGRGRGKCERPGKAWHEGVRTGYMGTCTLGGYVPKCLARHLGRRTAGRGTCEGEGLLRSQESRCSALGGKH